MPLLGTLVLDIEESEAEEVALRKEVKVDDVTTYVVLKGMFASLRLLPKAITERMLKPVQRKLRKKEDEESDEAIARWMREHVAKALVDTRGVEFSFQGRTAVKVYAALLGVHVDEGQAELRACLDGHWTEEFKARFLEDFPAVVAIMLDGYKRIAQVGAEQEREEEEGKGQTSPTG